MKRKHYDHQGNVIKDADESDVVAVTTYQLTDDTNRNFDALLSYVSMCFCLCFIHVQIMRNCVQFMFRNE